MKGYTFYSYKGWDKDSLVTLFVKGDKPFHYAMVTISKAHLSMERNNKLFPTYKIVRPRITNAKYIDDKQFSFTNLSMETNKKMMDFAKRREEKNLDFDSFIEEDKDDLVEVEIKDIENYVKSFDKESEGNLALLKTQYELAKQFIADADKILYEFDD